MIAAAKNTIGGAPQTCTGGPSYNSFNGHGQVNALTAVGG
jgi:hypothetical protein